MCNILFCLFQLPPSEMENIVLRHPAVSDVTVTMAPLSASYRAQVVLSRGCFDISSNQIRDFVNGRILKSNRCNSSFWYD